MKIINKNWTIFFKNIFNFFFKKVRKNLNKINKIFYEKRNILYKIKILEKKKVIYKKYVV